MNTKLHLTIITLLLAFSGFSQDIEKIKGSRNVTTEITELDTFYRLVVAEDFEINLLQGLTPSIQIEADDNLFEAVSFGVEDGTLKFSKLMDVRSSKKFEITVIYKDSLSVIELKDDAELASGNKLKFDNLTLLAGDNTRAYLTLEADEFIFNQDKKNKTELNVTSKAVIVKLNENANLKALINASEINIDMAKNAYAKIEGDTDNLSIITKDNTTLKAEKLTAKNCDLITENKADVYIEVNSDLKLEASGTTETYIYGTPKIELNKFENDAVLRKK